MSRSQRACLIAVAIGVLGGAGLLATGVQARQESRVFVNPQPLPPHFFPGLVGLASGQHARLNIVSLLPKPAPGEVPPPPRIFDLTFLTDQGGVVATSKVEVSPGESKALEIGFEDLANAIPPGPTPPPLPPNRFEFRPIVIGEGILNPQNPSGLGPAHPPSPCLPSLEIFDLDSGKTTVSREVLIAFLEGDPDRLLVLDPNGALGRPQVPLPTFLPGLVGLATGQHARLSVVSLLPKPMPGLAPGDPTAVELTFFTDQGSVLATSTVQVGPGESKFLDISFDDALKAVPPGPTQTRLEIRAAAVGFVDPLAPAGAGRHPPQPCIPSLEIYDVGTGKTTVALLPAVQ